MRAVTGRLFALSPQAAAPDNNSTPRVKEEKWKLSTFVRTAPHNTGFLLSKLTPCIEGRRE